MAVTSILNNVAALGASYELGITGTGMHDTITRLTTGKRINMASDDASGLVIANGLTSSTQIDTQGQANANNALSQLQTQDGYLNEATNLLTRAAELAQEAQGSGAVGSALDAEFQAIKTTFANLIAGQTNSVSTALGSFTSQSFVITSISNLIDPSTSENLSTSAAAATAATAISTTLANLGAARGSIGAAEESLQAYSNVLGVSMQNQTSQLSQIQYANIANEVVNLTKFQILNQSGISALSKANQAGQSILSLLQ